MAKRKLYSPEFKLKAVLAVLKSDRTANQLAGELGVHPMVLSSWKRHFAEMGPQVFAKPRRSKTAEEEYASVLQTSTTISGPLRQ